MPLMHGKSKKAFSKNVEIEMKHGKPQDQALAIAYSVKRKAKKMASGGPVSAKSEQRPMPDQRANDSKMAAQNSGNKVPSQDQWTDRPDIKQSQRPERPGKLPIKHPKIMKGGTFTTKLRDQEDDLQSVDGVNDGPQHQPPEEYNESEASKSGPDVSALHMKKMAKGGMINDFEPMSKAEDDMEQHPAGLESDNDMMRRDQDEYMSGHNEMLAAGGSVESGSPDMNMADGGMIDNEEELEHAASIAAAIMSKRRKMARGGAILSEDSMESDDSDQADLSRNAEEDANMEDKASFDALRKENYSESHGLAQLDSPSDSNEHSPEHDEEDINDSDIVSAIRRKMKMRSAIVK